MRDKLLCELKKPVLSLLSTNQGQQETVLTFRIRTNLMSSLVSLTSKDGVFSNLRMIVTIVQDHGRDELQKIVESLEAPPNSLSSTIVSHARNAISVSGPVVGVLDQWAPLLEKISVVADIVKAVADVRPSLYSCEAPALTSPRSILIPV